MSNINSEHLGTLKRYIMCSHEFDIWNFVQLYYLLRYLHLRIENCQIVFGSSVGEYGKFIISSNI